MGARKVSAREMRERDLRVDRSRRSALQAGAAFAIAVAAPALLSACAPAPISLSEFGSMADAQRTLEAVKALPLRMASGWDMAHVLHHVAQSVEYSLNGFPQLKPAWFRASVGPVAIAVFEARGRMSHGLDEPIPGSAAITDGQPLVAAVDHLAAALAAFERHTGALAPHFAYGPLDKPAYARAHLMHLANHWQQVNQDPPKETA